MTDNKGFWSRHLDGPAGIRAIWRIAFPMIMSTSSFTVMRFADRLILSRYDKLAFAASLPAGVAGFMFMVFFLGTAGYANALIAQYHGSGQDEKCGLVVWQSIFFSVASYFVILLALPLGPMLWKAMGHDPAVAALEKQYFQVLIVGSIFNLLMNAFSTIFAGLGHTRVIMWANVSAMLLNIPLTCALVFGVWGLPEMGITGAAVATVASTALSAVIQGGAFFSRYYRKKFGTTQSIHYDGAMMRKLLKYGIPSGIDWMFGMAGFSFFIMMFGKMGADVQAALTIAINWDLVAFFPMLGLGVGTSVVFGHLVGAGKKDTAVSAAFSGLKVAYLYGGLCALFFIFIPGALVSVFADPASDEYREVFPLAKRFIRLASIYLLADATSVVFRGALRGAGDTAFVMVITIVGHWVVMVIPCWVLVYHLEADPVYVWLWFVGFVCTMATAFYLRFRSGRWRDIEIIERPVPEPPEILPQVGKEVPPE